MKIHTFYQNDSTLAGAVKTCKLPGSMYPAWPRTSCCCSDDISGGTASIYIYLTWCLLSPGHTPCRRNRAVPTRGAASGRGREPSLEVFPLHGPFSHSFYLLCSIFEIIPGFLSFTWTTRTFPKSNRYSFPLRGNHWGIQKIIQI